MNFSIIIPHKNIPVLLERLINSIPTREDLEIIVVDDHSDDNIVDFDHFPCQGRKHLVVLHNQGRRGAGFARNYALPMAKGRWILFADADDFFNSGFNEFLDHYINSDADVVYFNANSVDTDTLEPSNRVDHLHSFIQDYFKDGKYGELVMRYYFTEPWCKMIKKDLIVRNKIFFDDTVIHEDVKFSLLVGYYAKNILVDSRQLYCVTSRLNSLSRTQTHEAFLDELKVFAKWKKFLIDHQIPLGLPKFDYRSYNFTRHLYKNNKLFREEYRILREVGFSCFFIYRIIIKYLWISLKYKLGRLF